MFSPTKLPGPLSVPAAVVLPLAFVCGKVAAWCRAPGRRCTGGWAAVVGIASSCWADYDDLTAPRAIAQCYAFLVIWGAFCLGMRPL